MSNQSAGLWTFTPISSTRIGRCCGPVRRGNPGLLRTDCELAKRLSAGGLVVALDISEPMLTRAVLDNCGSRTCYVRGDAHHLPIDDGTFDAVCCFGALYLMPEPFQVAHEMAVEFSSRAAGSQFSPAVPGKNRRSGTPLRWAPASSDCGCSSGARSSICFLRPA
jgi:hypothetical protein